MLRLTTRRRAVLADKVPDVVNLVTGAIVIGFFVGEPKASWTVLAGAIALWIATVVFALIIAENKP